MLVYQSLRPAPLQVDVPVELEVLWVKVSPSSHPRHAASLLCCVVYQPPRASKSELLNNLTNTSDLPKVRYLSSKLIICGDFNGIDTIDLQNYLNLLQLVNLPTHGNNTLDFIISDLHDYYHPHYHLTRLDAAITSSYSGLPSPQWLSSSKSPPRRTAHSSNHQLSRLAIGSSTTPGVKCSQYRM